MCLFIYIDQFGHWFPQSVTQDENSLPDSSDGQNRIPIKKEKCKQTVISKLEITLTLIN